MDKTTLKKKSIKDPQSVKDEVKAEVIVKKNVKSVRKVGIRAYFSSKKNKLVEKLKNFKQLKREEISFVGNFIAYTLLYGLAVSYVVWGVFGVKVDVLAIPAWGVLVYLIKEEALNEIHKIISMMRTR